MLTEICVSSLPLRLNGSEKMMIYTTLIGHLLMLPRSDITYRNSALLSAVTCSLGKCILKNLIEPVKPDVQF